MKISSFSLPLLAASVLACSSHGHGHDHSGHEHEPSREWTREELAELERKWGLEWGFSGIATFAHLKHVKCLTTPSELYDIAVIGAPFDTAVSYRPGARFGPRAIRHASSRQTSFRGFNPRANINPYQNWATILDCGDIPVTPMDNAVALKQMTAAFTELGQRTTKSGVISRPRLVTLGGDHSLALPALRALKEVYGRPLRVLHFDAHLDTWHPGKYPSAWESEQAHFNHGSMFWMAGNEGLLSNVTAGGGASVHAGLRTRLSGDGWEDYEHDSEQGWVRISADDIDDIGTRGVIKRILDSFGKGEGEDEGGEDPVYLSVDIDVLDPAFAPGTGTPEPGGWTTRELIKILRGIEGLNIVGADVVEVAPAYQGAGEETALAAAQVVYEILSSMVKKGLKEMGKTTGKTTGKTVEGGHDEL
ncbi:arginase family-domain-containing protein [Diplogelasinospora grovesii]|uniref:Arginase family-domain-containing protein n=1 Tax=Diplogelasinospora grovesii TaxID=303347 RepID=A0AAN6NAZ9_9PEZI|nr:arginase family-domain-containing protein [Diplogelasinospora grovesii]